MSQLDALLERSRAPGTFVEKRTFTLARSKAIEKMREFTLRHPRQYVLELVQAAVFAGARWIAVDVTSDALVVAWVGGRTLGRRDLEGLFDHLFADQGHGDTRHLMQVAIGVNAVLQRKPRRVRIESGDGSLESTTRLDLDKRGKGQVGRPQDPLAGTYLYADFGSSWFSRFAATDTFPPEAQLVETRCLYTPTPILLNGSAPFGYRSSRAVQLFGVRRSVQLSGDRRGALGVPEGRVAPGLRIVVGGVWVCDREPDPLGPGLVGVIADDRLRKTADMSDIVEDARWVDLLHGVQPFATRLLRADRGDRYQPPRLPPRIADHVDTPELEETPAEPLPQAILQLAPRASLPLAALHAMDPVEPLFWIEEDVADSLQGPCDPSVFPYRVLVLTPGQARTLEDLLPQGPAPSRLTHPEDVSFVRNAMERRHVLHHVPVEVTLQVAGRRREITATLHLRLHLEGPAPRWDHDGDDSGVPVAVVQAVRTVELGRLALGLHDVSLVLEVGGAASPAPLSALGRSLKTAVQREAWRLLPHRPADSPADPRRLRLELALLADHARPHFERRPGGSVGLSIHLPSAWAPVAERLRTTPLAATTAGPLTLARLAALQGTDETVTLVDPADRTALEPLEAVFGYGHVLLPEDLAAPLAMVGAVGESWRPLGLGAMGDAQVSQVVVVFGTPVPPAPPEGWSLAATPVTAVAHWVRDGGAPRALGPAVEALLRHLRTLDASDFDLLPGAEHRTAERARALSSLAALRLAARYGALSSLSLRDDAGRSHNAATALRDGLPLVARGGARSRERTALCVTLDEARALEQARRSLGLEGPVPLLLDDPPSTWAIDRPDADAAWLVRLPVAWPGLSGWLGLRLPHDPTPGVLLETPDHLEVLPGFTEQLPCHGLLHLDADEVLGAGQRELLHFAGVQLYQALLRRLDGDLSPAERDAAQAYAAAYVGRAWRQAGGRLDRGLALTLATRVPVLDAEGQDWGSLREWLETPADARPPAPPGVDLQAPRTPGVPDLEDRGQIWDAVAVPLERALQAQVVGARCVVLDGDPDQDEPVLLHEGSSSARQAALVLRRDALAEAALRGDRTAEGLILLEGLRQLERWATLHGHRVSLLTLQQAVLAGRLARG